MGREDVLTKIEKINEVFPEPQCYLVALLLSSEFQGKVLYNHSHCITKIGDHCYDKGGMVSEEDMTKDEEYRPMEEAGIWIKRSLVRALIEKHKDL